MFNSNDGYSLSDIAAATNNNGNGFGFGNGNGAWWVILFILAFAGGWGNGWGNNGNGAGTNFMNSINTDYLAGTLRDIQSNLSSNFLTLNNEMLNGFCDNRNAFAQNTANITAAVTNGFNTQNLANLQNTNAIQRDIYSGTVGAMQNTQLLQSTLNQMAADSRADTCALNTNNATNTRDIIDAINTGNQMLANMMQQNKVDAMQDKINDLQAQNQALNLAASQAAQNNAIIGALRPSPVPAYITQNPYCNCGQYGMATV